MSPRVWEASGHLEVFTDPLVECLACHQRFREDHLEGDPHVCPNCGNKAFTDPRNFNLMFRTHMGPIPEDDNAVYLRPETAQGMFVDFAQVQTTSRKKIPFGIAQIGKSFRNEITPGNFIFRTREFEQMEMEFFVEPGTDEDLARLLDRAARRTGTSVSASTASTCGCANTTPTSSATTRSERWTSSTRSRSRGRWGELEGIANRTDYDLKAHEKASGEDLSYFDQEQERRYHPYVIEPAGGVDRSALAFLLDAYRVQEAPTAKGGTEKRTYLALHHDLAPIKVAVLPLSRNEQLVPDGARRSSTC